MKCMRVSFIFQDAVLVGDFLLVWLGRCAVFWLDKEKKSEMRSDRQKGWASKHIPTLRFSLTASNLNLCQILSHPAGESSSL
jgi:hypothetical protein